jgi:hypothetical protein
MYLYRDGHLNQGTVAGKSEASLAREVFSRCAREKAAFYLHPGCIAAGLVIEGAMRYF